jgi:hypothetical protein
VHDLRGVVAGGGPLVDERRRGLRVEHQWRGAEALGKKRNGTTHRGGRASVRWQGEVGVAAFRRQRTALEGGGRQELTLLVSEMTGQVRGGLSGKSEEGCVWWSTPEMGETVARWRSAWPTVAGTMTSRAELPVRLRDVAEASSMAMSSSGR